MSAHTPGGTLCIAQGLAAPLTRTIVMFWNAPAETFLRNPPDDSRIVERHEISLGEVTLGFAGPYVVSILRPSDKEAVQWR